MYYNICYILPRTYNSSHSCQPASELKFDIDLLTGAAIKKVGEVERNYTQRAHTALIVQRCVCLI